MACYHPQPAFKLANGQVVFHPKGTAGRDIEKVAGMRLQLRGSDVVQNLWLPCGQCIGCRLESSRQWMIRCLHESKAHKENCFVTLTFNDEHYPYRGMLDYGRYQLFMRYLRREIYPHKVRFYMCGEYGESLHNPHFHALLFGWKPGDLKMWKKGRNEGNSLYRSALLEKLWPFGFSTVGSVTPQSAGYCSGYCTKKMNGAKAAAHYRRIDPVTGEIYQLPPEFNQMSRKPGIGYSWFQRFTSDFYPSGSCVIDGREQKAPRYYDRAFERLDALGWETVQYDRYIRAVAQAQHNTDERLFVREEVATARHNFYNHRAG